MRMTPKTRKQISAEAAEWFVQFQDRVAAEPDRHGFSEWLLRSPAHVEEYLRVSCSWSLANVGAEGDLDAGALIAAARKQHDTDNVVSLPSRLGRRRLPEGSESRRSLAGWTVRSRWIALAASVVLGIAAGVGYLTWNAPMTFQTMVGEQRSFTLQDGSVV